MRFGGMVVIRVSLGVIIFVAEYTVYVHFRSSHLTWGPSYCIHKMQLSYFYPSLQLLPYNTRSCDASPELQV